MNKKREYEATFILNPELTEEDHEAAVERIKNAVETNSGEISELDDWGEKRLAYPINDYYSGHYYLLSFTGETETVNELERNCKLIGGVLRYMVIRKEK